MSFLKLSLFPILVFCLFASVKAQTAKVIYDGRKNSETAKMNSADEKLLKSVILPKAREFWKNAEGCEETFDIRDFTRGSFTAPNSAQTAYLYNFCETGHNFANVGIVVIENGKLAAHYVYEGGAEYEIAALPDIDGDGLNELVIGAGGTNQGITWGAATILELAPQGIKKFGSTQTYEDNCGAVEKGCTTTTYKISAKFGAKPVFYRQEYAKNKKIWKIVGTQKTLKMTANEIQYSKLD